MSTSAATGAGAEATGSGFAARGSRPEVSGNLVSIYKSEVRAAMSAATAQVVLDGAILPDHEIPLIDDSDSHLVTVNAW